MSSNKDNMKKAIKELFGVTPEASEAELEADAGVDVPDETYFKKTVDEFMGKVSLDDLPELNSYAAREELPTDKEKDVDTAGDSFDNVEFPTYPAYRKPFTPPTPPPAPIEVTVIAAGTTIYGNMQSKGDVDLKGNIKGNLDVAGNVTISGKTLGDITGRSVTLNSCTVQGNIKAEANIHMDTETIVVGNISASELITDGKIKGNVMLDKRAVFQGNAVLLGDVIAQTISMVEGANIQGLIRVAQNADIESMFEDKVEI